MNASSVEAVASRSLGRIASALGLPIEAFFLDHERSGEPDIPVSREAETIALLKAYFGIDDADLRLFFVQGLHKAQSSG